MSENKQLLEDLVKNLDLIQESCGHIINKYKDLERQVKILMDERQSKGESGFNSRFNSFIDTGEGRTGVDLPSRVKRFDDGL